ncbi:MAG: substrate-binding domain-containing protein, partial [Pyrinomonadaceae bacterium]
PKLAILFKGDKFLVNTYHALSQPGASLASKFIEQVASKEGQKIIAEYGKASYGEGIYNSAAYAAKYDQ